MPLSFPRKLAAATSIAAFVIAGGCTQSRNVSAGFERGPANAKVNVATTISTLNSFVEGVGGDLVAVQNIVPVGASPETFQPAPQDVAILSNAQLLVENGAGLETWLDRMLSQSNNPNLVRVDCTQGLKVENGNPHLWMDPQLAKQYVRKIRDGLVQVDPQDAKIYKSNAADYLANLDRLSKEIQGKIDTIPPGQRMMIVFHNAWFYYNRRFGITTLGFVERNPGQEPNPQQIAQLIDLAKQHHVHGVFSEPEYSPKILYTIAQGAGIKVVENLYDDSIGTIPQVANYNGMLLYDTDVIVKTLK
ncbi:MAG: zinc ABC transporter substrate-binding protein [Candidatus Eremiobacteraeota bacterium]|nr:zinc ABC transporter substrate-binding protein [Candidatus Eremiobacteraeota bacterium]